MRRLGALFFLVVACDRVFAVDGVDITDARSDATPDAPPPFPMVYQEAGSAGSNTMQIGLDLPVTPVPTHVLVAIGGAASGTPTILGGGVAWTVAASSNRSPTSYIWYGVTNGATSTVKLTSTATDKMWLLVTEWTQLYDPAPFDGGSASGMGSATTGTIDLAVTTSGPDLLVFAVSCFGAIGTPSGTWSQLPQEVAGSLTQSVFHRVVATSALQDVQATYQQDWDATLAAFRIAPSP